jgi:hypothetical protein
MKDPEAKTHPAVNTSPCDITWNHVNKWFRDKTIESIAEDRNIWECRKEFVWGRNGIRFDHADTMAYEMNHGKDYTVLEGVVSHVASCKINLYMGVILYRSAGSSDSKPHMFLSCYHNQYGLLWRIQVNVEKDGDYGKWQAATIIVKRMKHDITDEMRQYIDSLHMTSRDRYARDSMAWGAEEFEDPWHCKIKSEGCLTGFLWRNHTQPLYGAGFLRGESEGMYTIEEGWWNAFESDQLEMDNHADAQTAVTISSTIPVYLI